jgi:type II secretory pathway predicted ATPase ExeA
MNMQDHSIQKVMPMTIHLQKFVDRVRGQEARGARDLVLTINEARDLHADITRLLLVLQNLQEQQIKTANTDVVKVEIQGGSF